jgi:hypothetical protein
VVVVEVRLLAAVADERGQHCNLGTNVMICYGDIWRFDRK